MKIREGFMLREVADSWVVVAVGANSVDFNGMLTLNETGALLWKTLEAGGDRDAMIAAILDEYEVAEKIAAADVDAYIAKLREIGCIED